MVTQVRSPAADNACVGGRTILPMTGATDLRFDGWDRPKAAEVLSGYNAAMGAPWGVADGIRTACGVTVTALACPAGKCLVDAQRLLRAGTSRSWGIWHFVWRRLYFQEIERRRISGKHLVTLVPRPRRRVA